MGTVMTGKKKGMLLMAVTLFALLVGGCGARTEKNASDQTAFLTLQDDANRTVVLAAKPEKIVALSPSFLELLGAVDATVIGRPSSKTDVPTFVKAAEEVGNVNNINIEKVVALKPDLVIAYQGRHDKFVPILESNHIPVLVVRMKTYQDVQETIKRFAAIVGAPQKGEALAVAMDEKIRAVTAKLPDKSQKVAILFSTAKSVTVQLEGSIAGTAAKMLGFENVAVGSKTMEKDADSTPYSIETLVQQNPDRIFVVTMGNLEEIQKRMTEDVESNPAWSSLQAVKNKKVHFLPQELFLLNPGLRYPEAVQTMAKAAYPEVFEDAK